MFDQEDEGTRIGVWTALAVVFVVVVGLIGGLVLRQLHAKQAGAGSAAVSFIEVPLDGEVVGAVYFPLGKSALPDGAEPMVMKIAQALQGVDKGRLLLSGFHDASGSAAVNAEIAKQRAIALRTALLAEGVPADRIALRKPEVALGDADPIEARRVEARLAE
jgi:outer membrane protein OmpA-like peptidoglycan-associated protein